MTDKGFTDQVEGKVKETIGKLTDDASLKAEGVIDKAAGKTKEITSDVKDVASELAEKAKEVFDSKDKK
ncbi:CsbD-like protein [Oribacterium sp. oral taxon 078 str. F0262]|uniref:CsbD family protein n=1 Tax=Oribacterium sp. oral taxon 078 TaxID=652706 RepID=UPI0001BCBFB0|nr:CsbD family protein [Oribacterium sp. oral taxon 078]EFE91985.1 CsbD-like protein [Oribacterium sp. oral taxon 078 str. F0262]